MSQSKDSLGFAKDLYRPSKRFGVRYIPEELEVPFEQLEKRYLNGTEEGEVEFQRCLNALYLMEEQRKLRLKERQAIAALESKPMRRWTDREMRLHELVEWDREFAERYPDYTPPPVLTCPELNPQNQ